MTTTYIKERLDMFKSMKSTFRDEVKEYVTDKSIPLDERWQLFIDSNIGKNDPYLCEFDAITQFGGKGQYASNLYEDVMHDGERHDKYTTIYVENIVKSFEELLDEYEDWLDQNIANVDPKDKATVVEDYDPKYTWIPNITEYLNAEGKMLSRESIKELKEEIMSQMIRSYTFDW